MCTKKRFTLVELLVVIAIIAILAGLLIPSIVSILITAKQAECLNNLRQIGTAIIAYSNTYGEMPRWTEDDDTPEELATALGRLYAEGTGFLKDPKIFSCPLKPSKKPDAEGDQINGFAAINHVDETSFSLTRGLNIGDQENKIIVADRGDGAGKGFYNHESNQNCLYTDTHVKLYATDNPADDCDLSGLYTEGDGGNTDTIFY